MLCGADERTWLLQYQTHLQHFWWHKNFCCRKVWFQLSTHVPHRVTTGSGGRGRFGSSCLYPVIWAGDLKNVVISVPEPETYFFGKSVNTLSKALHMNHIKTKYLQRLRCLDHKRGSIWQKNIHFLFNTNSLVATKYDGEGSKPLSLICLWRGMLLPSNAVHKSALNWFCWADPLVESLLFAIVVVELSFLIRVFMLSVL